VQRREWVGQFGGGAYGESGRNGSSSRADGDDNVVRQWIRETVEFLRENRVWLLGAAGVVALLSAVLKAYSRRP
jgi:hypothetical protein